MVSNSLSNDTCPAGKIAWNSPFESKAFPSDTISKVNFYMLHLQATSPTLYSMLSIVSHEVVRETKPPFSITKSIEAPS